MNYKLWKIFITVAADLINQTVMLQIIIFSGIYVYIEKNNLH